MNRIGWFVVCLVLVSAIPAFSKNESTIIEDNQFSKNETFLKPQVQSDVSLLGLIFDQIFGWLTDVDVQENVDSRQGRTFGQKRIQFMMLAPIMYKLGVMMTMLMVLTVISAKGLVIGAILLILKLSSFLAKFYVGWQPSQGHGQIWPHQQPVHVHVHGQQAHHQAYSAWPPDSDTISPDEHYYYKG